MQLWLNSQIRNSVIASQRNYIMKSSDELIKASSRELCVDRNWFVSYSVLVFSATPMQKWCKIVFMTVQIITNAERVQKKSKRSKAKCKTNLEKKENNKDDEFLPCTLG